MGLWTPPLHRTGGDVPHRMKGAHEPCARESSINHRSHPRGMPERPFINVAGDLNHSVIPGPAHALEESHDTPLNLYCRHSLPRYLGVF